MACHPLRCFPVFHARDQQAQFFFIRLIGAAFAHDLAVKHDRDAVRQSHDFFQLDRIGDFLAFRTGASALVDSAKLAELTDIGGSLRRVAQNTSVADAVSLVRHVDSPQDAARLARVTDAMGPKARAA
ncbi:hypothetical protein OAE29_01275, partial [Octadecabacter sp.]|nr:hypothetical protein [Octadecabacter sp.]